MKLLNGLSWNKSPEKSDEPGLSWTGHPQERGPENEPDESKNTANEPAREFEEGCVKVRIWQNGPDDAPDFKVDFIRTYSTSRGDRRARNLRPEDIRHALRGLFQAEKWCDEKERLRRGRRFPW
jgi:hypothetical protein